MGLFISRHRHLTKIGILIEQKQRHIAVIGGGPAGLAAAITAARAGAYVCIYEKAARLGKPILKTGNGRCNLSNLNICVDGVGTTNVTESFDNADSDRASAAGVCGNINDRTSAAGTHNSAGSAKNAFTSYNNPNFVIPTLTSCDTSFIQKWFENMGLFLRADSEGRLYPACNSAAVVRNVLESEVEHLGIEIHCNTEVDFVEFLDNTEDARLSKSATQHKIAKTQRNAAKTQYKAIVYSHMLEENEQHSKQTSQTFDAVVIATGGGSKLLENCGHNIEPFSPTLCGIACNSKLIKELNNVRTKCKVRAYHTEKNTAQEPLAQESGEVLFRDYGLSGIVILNMSRLVQKGDILSLDLLPDKSVEDIAKLLVKNAQHLQNIQELQSTVCRHKLQNKLTLTDIMRGMFVPQLSNAILKSAGFSSTGLIPKQEQQLEIFTKIAFTIKNFCFTVAGNANEKFAQVTRGGASTDKFDCNTMCSKLQNNLFACGETLDIDAACGGYNLHWAWASGIVAGKSAAANAEEPLAQ